MQNGYGDAINIIAHEFMTLERRCRALEHMVAVAEVPYRQTVEWVRSVSETSTEFSVLSALISLNVDVSLRDVAAASRVTSRTVSTTVDALEVRGVVSVERHGRGLPNIYTINAPIQVRPAFKKHPCGTCGVDSEPYGGLRQREFSDEYNHTTCMRCSRAERMPRTLGRLDEGAVETGNEVFGRIVTTGQ